MAKMIVACLENGTIYNNLTRWAEECGNGTAAGSGRYVPIREQSQHGGSGGGEDEVRVEHVVSIVVAICFGLIGLVGLFGNSLVVLGEWMRLPSRAPHIIQGGAGRRRTIVGLKRINKRHASFISVIAVNPSMRSTTNLLIINLACADILFVFFCVPFTAVDYVLPMWPFGNFWCKIVSLIN